MTTLINSFHGTEYRTRKSTAEIESLLNTHPSEWTAAERSFARRAHAALCGSADCTCGNDLGMRS